MREEIGWRDYLAMNLYVFGISFAAGSITTLLLP